jgi:hypothetical protein
VTRWPALRIANAFLFNFIAFSCLRANIIDDKHTFVNSCLGKNRDKE